MRTPAGEALARDKKAARASAIALREAIAPGDRAALAAALAAAELPFIDTRRQTVSAFHPVGAELDIMMLVRRLAADGHRIALPVVVALRHPLAFRLWAPGAPLEAGVRGIPVPPAGAAEVVPDILLVPLLQFDRRGHRLGYGGGFYDRTLAALRAGRDIVAVGVGFSMQEVERVPAGPGDARLDWILTDRGARRVPGRAAG